MKTSATSGVGKAELSELERDMRRLVVLSMAEYGVNVTSIARIMSMTPSTISRMVKKETDSE